MSNEKIYVNSIFVKTRNTSIGEIIKLSINAEELAQFLKQRKDQKGFVRIDLIPKKSVGANGLTHSAVLDTWQPSEAQSTKQTFKKSVNQVIDDSSFDDSSFDDDVEF